MEKALVLYSGGLDSRLAVKLMQEKGYGIEAIHFSLPFGCGCCNLGCNFNFTQKEGIKMTIFDCTKGELFDDYLEIVRNPKHGRGSGINPCKDCKIWMLKKAKEYADKNKIKVIATGEVIGQRPMSQTKSALALIEKEVGFKIERPLIEAGCEGRQRKKQMELAEKFKITYPSPAGGCLLCEKFLANRLKILVNLGFLNGETLPLSKIGRHFIMDDEWFVVGRNEEESELIEKFKCLQSDKGTPAVFYQKNKEKAQELQNAYKEKNPDKFKEWKI